MLRTLREIKREILRLLQESQNGVFAFSDFRKIDADLEMIMEAAEKLENAGVVERLGIKDNWGLVKELPKDLDNLLADIEKKEEDS